MTRNKAAFASVAVDSDHSKEMATNAYIKRGVSVHKAEGGVKHHYYDMPDRGWSKSTQISYSEYVEDWD